jgi:hypothetical protein
MGNWSLQQLLSDLHDDIESKLAIARRSFGHPGTKGDASESVWLEMLEAYLPNRYSVAKAHIVDSKGAFSDQIDVVIFDRQYSPFILSFQGQRVIPAESVYAVFEAKQTINSTHLAYAQDKVASVRRLHRTSLPIPYAGGVYPPKALTRIIGGLLAFESDWSPALGNSFMNAFAVGAADGRLDLGCVAAHGLFSCESDGTVLLSPIRKPTTAFLFELIARLQEIATVPMIDVRAYGRWLDASVEVAA